MKLSKEQEDLLKNVSSVEVRAMIRSRMKILIKDIHKAEDLMKQYQWAKGIRSCWSNWYKERIDKGNELNNIRRKLVALELKKNGLVN